MKSRTLTCITAMTLFAALADPVQLAAQKQVRYTVTDLGTLGGTFSQAYGLNDRGSVVGYATLMGDTALHAFLWRKGVMTDLGTLAPSDTAPVSAAYSINDNDEVVGISETSTLDPNGLDTCGFGNFLVCLPVVWRKGAITALPTLGGPDGQASAINNEGQVVGIAQTDKTDPTCQTPVLKPIVWEGGHARALPTAPFRDGIVGGAPGPAGNNDRGEVVGIATTCDGSSSRALVWEKHNVIDMGTLGGLTPVPVAINDKRQVTGTGFANVGFLWQNGVASSLGTLPGDVESHGNNINGRSQIVGQSCDKSGFPNCSVFLWENGSMEDLNDISSSLLKMVDAGAISSDGKIVGLGIRKDTGEYHAFLAIPCEEEHDNDKDCEEQSMTDSHDETRQVPKFVVPENLRKLVRGRVGFPYPAFGSRPPE